jgi:hypothetical protein
VKDAALSEATTGAVLHASRRLNLLVRQAKLFEHLAELGRDLEELGDLPVKEGNHALQRRADSGKVARRQGTVAEGCE